MRRVGAGAAAATVLLLCGCGGDVEVAQAAVREVGVVVGDRGVTALKLTGEDVSRLASQAGVSEGVIRDTAPQLDNRGVWSRSMTNLREMYTDTPGEVRSNLVDLACDGVRGKITSRAQLEQNISDRFTGYTPNQGKQLADDVVGLWQDLYEARTSSDPDLQASAVLTCFTVQQAVG